MRVVAMFLGLLVIAAAIAGFAPASLVDARLASISHGAVRVSEAQGTLWQGQGVMTSPDGQWRMPVAWTLHPLPLLSGVTAITLGMPEDAAQGVRGSVEFRSNRAAADSLIARVPASAVASKSGPLAIKAGGDVDLRIDALSLAPSGSSGGVSAQWRNARVVGTGWPVLELGTLNAKLAVRGNALAGPVSNQGGAVRISGDNSIGADRINADLRLHADATATPAVRAALEALGPADASGAVALRVDRSTR